MKDVEVGAGPTRSIYSIHSPLRCNLIKFTAAMGFLLSYCSAIYLPALKCVQDDLHIGQELVAATVGVYLVANGVSFLAWGPASDRFGRAPVYGVACVSYIAACIGCMFAPNIQVLLVFRALQGGVVAAFSATAMGVLADVVPPLARGQATGSTMIAVALGVVVSPVVGGGLSRVLGWRSTFAAVAVFCFLLGVALVVFVRKETHQYYVLKRLAKEDPVAATNIIEWESVMANPPKLDAPWMPVKYLLEPAILPHALVCVVMWAVTLCIMWEALPTALAKDPYNLSPALVGVAMLVDGLPTIIASPLGGFISDKFAAASPGLPLARLAPNTLVLLVLGPAAAAGAAWSLQYRAHIAILITTVGVNCSATGFYGPALFSYITQVKQSAPAAATCGVLCIINLISGLVMMAGANVSKAMGFGWWVSCLAILQFLVTAVAGGLIVREQCAHRAASAYMPPVAGRANTGGT